MEIATTQALFRQKAIEETSRRREIQVAYNAEQGITPTTIQKAIRAGLKAEVQAHQTARAAVTSDEKKYELGEMLRLLEAEMLEAAANLDFEQAAELRDRIDTDAGQW